MGYQSMGSQRVGHDLAADMTYAHTTDMFASNFLVCSVAKLCSIFATPWTGVCQASLSLTISQSLPKFLFIELVMPSDHLILCHPLLLLPSIFPASGSFLISWLFTLGGQSIGASASASIVPMGIQD